MNTLVLDSIAFDNFKTVNEDNLSIVEGGINGLGFATSYLGEWGFALGAMTAATPVGAALYGGAALCMAGAAAYYAFEE